MSSFPNISRPDKENCSQKLMKLQELSPFENGVRQSRAVSTVGKHSFTIGWDAGGGLPLTEFDSLETHFEANAGGSFPWTHWDGATLYTVRYTQSELPESRLSKCGNYMKVSGLILEEV